MTDFCICLNYAASDRSKCVHVNNGKARLSTRYYIEEVKPVKNR